MLRITFHWTTLFIPPTFCSPASQGVTVKLWDERSDPDDHLIHPQCVIENLCGKEVGSWDFSHHIGGHHFELEVVQCKCLVSITVTWVREETLSSSPSKCLHLDLTLSAWIFLCPFLNLVNYLVHLNQWSVRISYGRQETLQPRLPPRTSPAPPGGPGERRLQSDLCVQPPQEGEYSLCLCVDE